MFALAAVLLAPQIITSAQVDAAKAYSDSRGGAAILIRQVGQPDIARYSRRGGPDQLQMLASGSKTFQGIMALAAVQDGLIKLDDPVGSCLESWRTGDKAKVTFRQLLSLSSGLPSGTGGLRGPAWKDYDKLELTGTPGKTFIYGPAPFNTFGMAIESKLKGKSYEDHLKQRILDPLGVKVDWRGRCADGRPQLAGGAFMTTKDWANVGQFLLQKGQWKGKQLIKASLFDELTKPMANPGYGLTCWLSESLKKGNRSALRNRMNGLPVAAAKHVPNDLYMAAGAGNQRLFIIPSRGLVIVRMGGLGGGDWDDAEFLKQLLG